MGHLRHWPSTSYSAKHPPQKLFLKNDIYFKFSYQQAVYIEFMNLSGKFKLNYILCDKQ